MTAIKTTAYWYDDREAYYCEALDVWSLDGDEWTTPSGEPATSREFAEATVVLVGGPRDGVTVG